MLHTPLAAVAAGNQRCLRRRRWHAALAWGVLLTASAVGCNSDPATTGAADNPAGALTGELTAVSILDAQGVPSMSYFLTPPSGGSPMRLLFASDPNLTSSTRLRVWGQPDGDTFRVQRQVLLPDETSDDTGL